MTQPIGVSSRECLTALVNEAGLCQILDELALIAKFDKFDEAANIIIKASQDIEDLQQDPDTLDDADEPRPLPQPVSSLSAKTEVYCKFCHRDIPAKTAHLHDDGWVCDECWDERLRSTE